jgi:FkbM family methyltransferase
MSILEIKKILFQVYLLIPGSRYLFELIKKFYLPRYRIRKLLRFKGVFNVTLGDDLSIRLMHYGNTIENELFWCGAAGWEGKAIRIWKLLSDQSLVVFDIGANTGLYSLVSAKVNPSSLVFAFEPVPRIMERLKKNIDLNGVTVSTFQFALSDQSGHGRIFSSDNISDTFDQASLNQSRNKGTKSKALSVSVNTLSNFIVKHQVTNIDLMKIDVESFEPQVIRGMGPYLKEFAPTLLIEVLTPVAGAEIERLIADINYEFYMIDEKRGYLLKQHLVPGKGGNNFLLLNRIKHPNLVLA